MSVTAFEGDTKDFELHGLKVQGAPLTLADPPDEMEYQLKSSDGSIASGTISEFFYDDSDAADPIWRLTVPIPMNVRHSSLRIVVTKGSARRTFKVLIFVESE